MGLERSVSFARGGRALQFSCWLRGRDSKPFSFWYGAEFHLSLKDAHVNRIGETPALKRFSVVDPAAGLEVSWAFSRPARIWHFPREDAAAVGNRKERRYQGVSVIPLWKVSLPARDNWSVRWTVAIGEPDAGA